MDTQTEMKSSQVTQKNKLFGKWVLWAHLPHDTDWSLSSYKEIICLESIEESLMLFENLPEIMIKNCMLFLMRKNIKPIWEDEKNRSGGCFSYKINNKIVASCWKNLSYTLLGESLATPVISKCINGITISPKKNFCIVKIWLSNCDYQNPEVLTKINDMSCHGCLFKKHIS